MANSQALVQSLKTQLKRSGITYKILAGRLSLSESAIKQMFASGNFSLKRLDQLCDAIGIDITELVQLLHENEQHLEELDLALENELASDPKLLLVAYCLVNRWAVDDIMARFAFESAELIGYLVKLDKIKMIELLPNNRIRLLISSRFKWRKNGPIEHFFHSNVKNEFLQGDFNSNGALQLIKNADLTEKGQKRIVERLHSVGTFFDEVALEDQKTSLNQRYGTTMLIAIRNWEFSTFSEFERKS